MVPLMAPDLKTSHSSMLGILAASAVWLVDIDGMGAVEVVVVVVVMVVTLPRGDCGTKAVAIFIFMLADTIRIVEITKRSRKGRRRRRRPETLLV